MRRVVVTGLGIVSSIGNSAEDVLASLKAGKSGITADTSYAEHGFRSQISGKPDIDVSEHIDKRPLRFMGPGAAYAHIAMQQAIADAGFVHIFDAGRTSNRVGKRRAQTYWAICSAKMHVIDRIGKPGHSVQNQRNELFDHIGLFHITALYRHRRRTNHDGQTRHDVRRWWRRIGLDPVVPV